MARSPRSSGCRSSGERQSGGSGEWRRQPAGVARPAQPLADPGSNGLPHAGEPLASATDSGPTRGSGPRVGSATSAWHWRASAPNPMGWLWWSLAPVPGGRPRRIRFRERLEQLGLGIDLVVAGSADAERLSGSRWACVRRWCPTRPPPPAAHAARR